mmetsp:Transcript_1858/g.5325  ORF Transcript_1858/g.5325 Transcript_1858/m.5325 type:complete len:234 (-) Transcript_1858:101-802(-)
MALLTKSSAPTLTLSAPRLSAPTRRECTSFQRKPQCPCWLAAASGQLIILSSLSSCSRGRSEETLLVEAQLGDRLENVLLGAVPSLLARALAKHIREPALRQFIDRGHVHETPAQVVLHKLSHVAVQELLVLIDGIAREVHAHGLCVFPQEFDHLEFRVSQGRGALKDALGQARCAVGVHAPRAHTVEHGLRMADDHFRPIDHAQKVPVCEHTRDFQDDVSLWVEACHLEINP